ncbi:MAG: hypothetical protein KOO69_05075 [Victivallales bacterium]|nr:hypothetical protein [Victivallales bacterium]
MWKCFIFLIIVSLLFTSCTTDEQIMLAKLEESDWYKSEAISADKANNDGLDLNTGYIFAGKVKEIRYNYYQKTISEVVLSPSRCLLAPSYWDEWFDSDTIRLDAKNNDFKNGYFPTVGEYWAFGVIKGLKNRYRIKSAEKLFSETNFSSGGK